MVVGQGSEKHLVTLVERVTGYGFIGLMAMVFSNHHNRLIDIYLDGSQSAIFYLTLL